MHGTTCVCHIKKGSIILFQGDFQDIRESASEKNFHYHLDLSCVQRRHPSFEPGEIAIQESVKANFKDSHKRLLRDTMDIQV